MRHSHAIVRYMTIRRIIWHSNAPWACSGYGMQTSLFASRLQALGYDVLISTFAGLDGAPLSWDGMTVLPAGQDLYGSDTIPAHAHHGAADLVITLLDAWALNAELVKNAPLACWLPIDVGHRDMSGSDDVVPGLGDADDAFLRQSGAIPIAMSRYGEAALQKAGFNPLYVPHGVDTTVFAPRADRDELRDRAGLTGKFVIIMIAANKDAIRKSFFPQFEAFGRFRRKYCPEAVLIVHSVIAQSGGLDLQRMARECGIDDAVIFSNQYKTLMGLFRPADMAALINQADIGTNTAMGEGFGIPPLEMMACGVPVITTRGSAMTELSLGEGWLANGDPFWNPTHSARWIMPYITSIVDRYCFAYDLMTSYSRPHIAQRARDQALQYDVNTVTEQFWRPVLLAIAERLDSRAALTQAAGDASNDPACDTVVTSSNQPKQEVNVAETAAEKRRAHREEISALIPANKRDALRIVGGAITSHLSSLPLDQLLGSSIQSLTQAEHDRLQWALDRFVSRIASVKAVQNGAGNDGSGDDSPAE